MATGMKNKYQKTAVKELQKELKFTNNLEAPRLEKVVINIGMGRALGSASKPDELIEKVSQDLALITGQKPVVTKARKSIASFKLRAGSPVGLKVTLRKQRMYDFLDRLIHITLPRSRDFKGIKVGAVDQSGNLTIGIKEHTIFPEVSESNQSFGLEITVVSNSASRDQALALFRSLGFPLKQS